MVTLSFIPQFPRYSLNDNDDADLLRFFLHGEIWHGRHETSAPFLNVIMLGMNLRFDIPRKDEHIVWPAFLENLRSEDRDMTTGHEQPLFVGGCVNAEIEKFRAYAAIVEQGVALGRRTVCGNSFACIALGMQKSNNSRFTRSASPCNVS